jgi:hypothetical protein
MTETLLHEIASRIVRFWQHAPQPELGRAVGLLRQQFDSRRILIDRMAEVSGEVVGADGSLAYRWERGDVCPTPRYRRILAQVCIAQLTVMDQESRREFLRKLAAIGGERNRGEFYVPHPVNHASLSAIQPSGLEPAAEMARRAFLGLSGATILALATPGLPLELIRQGLTAVTEERAEATISEWEAVITQCGLDYFTTSPTELLESLMIDAVAIQQAILHESAEDDRRALHRIAAVLAAYVALTVGNLGQVSQAGRWWRTARMLADRSGDVPIRAWIRGQEVVRALYEKRPPERVLRLAAEAELVAVDAPPASLPELIGGKAQTLAILGREVEAEAALDRLRGVCAELPSLMMNEKRSLFAWTQDQLRYTESLVYSHLGKVDEAEEAQSKAVALYPPWYRRGPVQIELQRALCLVRAGDSVAGVSHAQTVMDGLPREQHNRPIIDLGHKVLAGVPAAQREARQVMEFREYLEVTG